MKINKIVALALIAVIISANVFAQSADEVIDKHLSAIGGADKWKAIKSMKMEAKIETAQAPGMEVLMTMSALNNKGFRQDITVMNMSIISAYDGVQGWMNTPAMMGGSGQPEPIPAEQADRIKEQTDLAGSLVDYKDKGHSVEFLGKEDLEGTDVFKVKLAKKNGDTDYYYFDASTYMMIKSESLIKMKGQEIKTSSLYSNFKQIEGLTFPFTMEQMNPMMGGNSSINFTSIVLNPPLDEGIFKMPAKK